MATYTRPCGCSDCNAVTPSMPCWATAPRCNRCGHPEWLGMTDDNGVCHHCRFWLDHVQYRVDYPKQFFVIDGKSYSVAPEDAKGFRGFGGDRFHIRRNDGSEVITTNLWYQGKICEHFRKSLPDDAVFVRGELRG